MVYEEEDLPPHLDPSRMYGIQGHDAYDLEAGYAAHPGYNYEVA